MNNKYLINQDDIEFDKPIGETQNSKTYQSIFLINYSKCVAKVIYDENHGIEPKFKEYVQILENLNHPGIIPFIGFSSSSLNELNQNIIVNKYAILSLQQIFDKRNNGEDLSWFDTTRKFIIIYGIANTMKNLHDHDIVHERLVPSNILLDENTEPQITDFKLSMIYPKFDFSIPNIIKNNLFYYVDPYTLNNDGEITEKSDVYAFAIIIIQILTDNVKIYQNEDDIEALINEIKSGLLPMIPENFPEELRKLLISCLQKEQDQRPSFNDICSKLDSIVDSLSDISTGTFKEYKEKITGKFKDQLDSVKSNSDEEESLVYLADDPTYEDIFNKIIKEIQMNENKFIFDRKKAEEMNFIFTKGADERLQKLYYNVKYGIPVLLEGPSGTSKTFSSEIVCRLLGRELICFNLSAETKIQDLIGCYFDYGPFYIAFTQGKVLLLDEIDLASPSVRQYIEEALESGFLSIETPGRPLTLVKMHPEFRIIATQKSKFDPFATRKQNVNLIINSKFIIIDFPVFTEDELLFIGKGLAEKFGYKRLEIVEDLVNFHKEWNEIDQCFTIREIVAAVKAFSEDLSINDTIMMIYGARYPKSMKSHLVNALNKKYPRLTQDSKKFNIPNFPGCYVNNSLIQAVEAILFSLDHGRHVIIKGGNGCGKSQLALWISKYYNKKIQNINPKVKSIFCFCTDEIKVSDLVGHQSPSGRNDGTSELIKWKDGFLTTAIREGSLLVLESIDESPTTINDYLNALLEQSYNNQQRYFLTWNPNEPKVPFNESFRILATANIDKIDQLSSSFLNKFDVIVLENQIEDDFDEVKKKELITTILDRYCADLALKAKEPAPDLDIKEEEEDFIFSLSDDENNNDKSNTSPENEKSYTYPKSIISLIIEKIKDETSISQISKLCNAIIKLLYFFKNNSKITENDVVDFAFHILQNCQNCQKFDIPDEIQNELLRTLIEIEDKTYDPFFYEESPSLRNFMAKMTAYSIIKQPVYIMGHPFVGKTSAVRAFSRMRPCKSKDRIGFRMHSFHPNTKVSHFFGSNALIDGSIVFRDGTLIESLKSGLVFIAEEFLVSSQSVMKSVAFALDSTIEKNIFIPEIGQTINIASEFQFIVCQKYLAVLSKITLPDSISQRFIYIEYPEQKKEDIQKICISIAKDRLNQRFDAKEEKLAINIANYMINLNERRLFIIPRWSLRDITKLFRRIYPKNGTKMYMNITPQHHVLFYTLSSVPLDGVKYVIDDVRSILKISFDLNDEEVDKYIECYNATPEIKEFDYYGIFMMKGPDIGISINFNINIENKLPSLWNAIFQIYLSDNREPLILSGNSGFKTCLAQHFLSNAQIITMNQNTNVDQLLGSSCLMTTYESEIFYLTNILKITKNEHKFFELREKLKNGQLKKDDILPIIVESQRKVPHYFHYAICHQLDKLFETRNKNQDSELTDLTLEFKPGLILNSILQGQPLILKNLDSVNPIVLERFNELFSGQQTITLTEDNLNTFTPEDIKVLTGFSNSFRVIATCHTHDIRKFSEAVLSHFTVISIPEYTKNEQKIVLKYYVQNNNLLFNISDIEVLSQFSSSCLEIIKIKFTFPQMINVVEITSKLNKETSIERQKMNIGITLYRVLGGLIKSLKIQEMLLKQIKIYFDIPSIYQNQPNEENESPLIIEHKDNVIGVRSVLSNLFLKCSTVHECLNPVVYTKSFNDLLDLLHMTLTIHNPLILDGPQGQGKHTAINFIANMLNIEIVQIMISQSTKVEDLFGKDIISRQQDDIRTETIETQFIKIIKSTNNLDKKYLIILENINNSSPDLLNALVPIFDSHTNSILLPNGSTIIKGKFDIIGIFNHWQSFISIKDKLPSSILNVSINYTVPKPTENEIKSIILDKFLRSGLTKDEGMTFFKNYQSAREFLSSENEFPEVFTLNDIEKYLLFRNITKGFIDESTITQMIFAYKFSYDDMTVKMLKHLNLENMKFSPKFSYDNLNKNLIIKISNDEKEKGLILPLLTECKDPTLITKIDSLTTSQKKCLIFLACSVLSKISCVIQGEAASGASYLIRLFAKLVGAKLNILQMKRYSNISMLAGQSILNEIKNDAQVFKEMMNPINHSEYEESAFIHAIRSGEWVLLDGINDAPSVIAEKISALCGSDPELNLCEFDPGLYFSKNKNSNPQNKIHDNFHLFITYNFNSSIESLMIDKTFLVKSMTFTLPSIDEKVENSSQMIYE